MKKILIGLLVLIAVSIGALFFLGPRSPSSHEDRAAQMAKSRASEFSKAESPSLERTVIEFAKPLREESSPKSDEAAKKEISAFLRQSFLENATWLRFELIDAAHVADSPGYKKLLEDLRKLGPQALPTILALLQELKPSSLRAVLLMALGDLHLADSTKLLSQLLMKENSLSIQSGVAYALGRMQTPEAFQSLRQRLELGIKEPFNHNDLYSALGSYGKIAIPLLVEEAERQLSSGNANGSWAHLFLGVVRGEDALPELKSIFESSKNSQLRAMALHALIENSQETNSLPLLLSILDREKDGLVLETAIRSFGNFKTQESAQVLLGWVEQKKDAKLAWDAAIALRDLKSPVALPALMEWARNPNKLNGDVEVYEHLRYAALEALAKIGGDEALSFIERCVQSKDAKLQSQAIQALAIFQKTGTTSLRTTLVASLADMDAETRSWAFRFLSKTKEDREQVVLATVSLLGSTQDESVQRSLMKGLSFFNGVDVAEASLPIAMNSPNNLNRMLAFEIMNRSEKVWKAPDVAPVEEKRFFREVLQSFSQGELLRKVPIDIEGEFGRSLIIDFMGRVGSPEDLAEIKKVSAQYSQDPKLRSVAVVANIIAERIRTREALKQ